MRLSFYAQWHGNLSLSNIETWNGQGVEEIRWKKAIKGLIGNKLLQKLIVKSVSIESDIELMNKKEW